MDDEEIPVECAGGSRDNIWILLNIVSDEEEGGGKKCKTCYQFFLSVVCISLK